jgi:L-fucose dehydrogenase
MDLELRDKVVLVTGGVSGIGTAIVRAVVSEGAAAVIADRSAQQEVAGAKVHVVTGDLTSAENCKSGVDQTLEHFGRLDALVNNAAARRHEA